MICGSPALVADTRVLLTERGFRRGQPRRSSAVRGRKGFCRALNTSSCVWRVTGRDGRMPSRPFFLQVIVMAGLDPAIHVLLPVALKSLDARVKPGHDKLRAQENREEPHADLHRHYAGRMSRRRQARQDRTRDHPRASRDHGRAGLLRAGAVRRDQVWSLLRRRWAAQGQAGLCQRADQGWTNGREQGRANHGRWQRRLGKPRLLPANHVWVYITDLIPRQMVEFGHVLPEPGDEAKWAGGTACGRIAPIWRVLRQNSQRCGPINRSSFSAHSTWWCRLAIHCRPDTVMLRYLIAPPRCSETVFQ